MDITKFVNEVLREIKRDARKQGIDPNKFNMEFWESKVIETIMLLIKSGFDVEQKIKTQKKDFIKTIILFIKIMN